MSHHSFDSDYCVTAGQKKQFQRDGFVKLRGFFNADVVGMLRHRAEVAMDHSTVDNFKVESHLHRVSYDLDTNATATFELLERRYFRLALTNLVNRDIFLISETCLEIQKNVSKGLPWHVGSQAFGYQFAEEFGCSLWAPLHPVDTTAQRGGMACVPKHVVSGEFILEQIEPAVVSTLRAQERKGVATTVMDYFAPRGGILNSPALSEILEAHQVEDDFEPGDVLLFQKNVIHRSIRLEEGALARRAAYVFRFVDAGSHFDLKRAQDLEYPVERYGDGPYPYKPFTRKHIEIAEAGAGHGDLLSDCAYFSNRERRLIRRAPRRASA